MLKVGRKKAEQRRGNGDEKEKDGEEKIKRIKRDDEGGRGGRRRIGEKRKGEKRGSLKKNKTKKRKESKREKNNNRERKSKREKEEERVSFFPRILGAREGKTRKGNV